MWDLRWLWLLINDSSPKDISPGKLSTAWKSLPVKEENAYVFMHTQFSSDCIQCEIIPRCRYRRQTLKVFVIKIFVLLGPQRPTIPFLTYAYFHYSDIKQTEKRCCRFSPALSPLECFSHRLWKQQPQGVVVSHEPLGQKARGHVMGICCGVLWGKEELHISIWVL